MTAKKPKAKAPRKVGRPSKYTPAILAEICARLSKGEPLAQICRDKHMPEAQTVRLWKERNDTISIAIAHAREEGFDAIADDALNIADDGTNDYMQRLADAGDEKVAEFILNGEHIQRSKLRVDTRLKLLAKWCPKRYGDNQHLTLAGDAERPIVVNLNMGGKKKP